LTVKQIREAGLNLPIVSGDGFDTELVTSVPGDKLANDVYFSTHTYREDNRPEVVRSLPLMKKSTAVRLKMRLLPWASMLWA
jgi:branched-chain amino acid transport system substrate-binding protein